MPPIFSDFLVEWLGNTTNPKTLDVKDPVKRVKNTRETPVHHASSLYRKIQPRTTRWLPNQAKPNMASKMRRLTPRTS